MATERERNIQMSGRNGVQRNWVDGITVPRPRDWDERPDLIGQTVIPHTCHGRDHGNNPGCICKYIGKPIVITKIYETEFVGTPSYHFVGGGSKTIQEREFSDETRTDDPDTCVGYIIEGSKGKFLGAGFNWIPAAKPLDGYIHNRAVVRSLLSSKFKSKRPTKAYPASSKYDGSDKQITGDAIPFDELKP